MRLSANGVATAALLLLSLFVVGPARAAADSIGSLLVKWREDVVPAYATSIPQDQVSALTGALSAPYSIVGRTADGAYQIELLAPMSTADARAAVNRVRMIAPVLYASLRASSDSVPAEATPQRIFTREAPIRRFIVKYHDFATTMAAARNQPLAAAKIDSLSAHAGQKVVHERAMSGGAYVVRLSSALSGADADALAQSLATDPSIEYVVPDRMKRPTLVPNDTFFGQQWDFMSPPAEPAGINMPPAWNITTGSASIYVGVLDTGILPHPDLIGRYGGGYDMIADPAVANDDDPPGCTVPGDTCSRDADPSDPGDWITAAEDASGYFAGCGVSNSSWHGTHVSGTIGATANNAMGVAGINWVSQIVPVRVLGKCGGYDSDIIDAIVWAAGGAVPGVPTNPTPVRVMNMSFGGAGACSVAFQTAINTALAAGAVMAIAAGNENQDASNSSPGNCNGVITVAALGRTGQRASYSNFGSLVEIAAPGGDGAQAVLSTLNDGPTSPDPTGYDYVGYEGTSMATPHVTGVVSLMLSTNPALTPAQVLARIQSTARPFIAFSSLGCTSNLGAVTRRIKYCGGGMLDAGAAIAPPASTTALQSSLNPSNVGDNVIFTATVAGSGPTGSVNFTDGGNALCSAVALTGGGNAPTAQCSTAALAAATHSIVASYGGDASNGASQSSPLMQQVNGGGDGGTSTNVALASAGAVASASSTFSASYPASAINNGDRAGLNFGAGGVWRDATPNVFPDWVEIDFNGAQTIDHVIVYSLQDNSGAPVDPPDTLTFTTNGLTAFDVQTWSGSAWVTKGSVSGNDLVKRSVPFASVTTSKIRVVINSALGNSRHGGIYSYVTEVEAWTAGSPAPGTTLKSSLNPGKPNQVLTFTASVTGTGPTGNVGFTSNGNPIAGCTAVGLIGAGNTRTAVCNTSFPATGTFNIVASYGGDGANAPSASGPLAQVIKSRH